MKTISTEKSNKVLSIIKPRKVLVETVDETYAQVNQISFQQNFKALIGHFKKNGSYNAVFRTY